MPDLGTDRLGRDLFQNILRPVETSWLARRRVQLIGSRSPDGLVEPLCICIESLIHFGADSTMFAQNNEAA